MKREPPYIHPHYAIKKKYAWLFWRECYICDQEFRKEHYWKIFMGLRRAFSPHSDPNVYREVCMTCLPTIEAAGQWREKEREKRKDEGAGRT